MAGRRRQYIARLHEDLGWISIWTTKVKVNVNNDTSNCFRSETSVWINLNLLDTSSLHKDLAWHWIRGQSDQGQGQCN